MANNRKIESRAITTLRSIVDDHPTMDHHFSEGDKEMCWDGYIRIFKDDNKPLDKGNYDDDVPVQIKGHVVKDQKYLKQSYTKQSVDLADLEVYFRNRGCIYFQILILEDGKDAEVFYSLLHPSKIKTYLEQARIKGNTDSITVKFNQLQKNGKELYKLVKQFSVDSIKQGSGLGQIVQRTARVADLPDKAHFSTTTIGINTPYALFRSICRGDTVMYTELDSSDIQIPVEWTEKIETTLTQTITENIGVQDRVYYKELQIETTLDENGTEKHIIHISTNVSFSFREGSFKLNISFVSPINQLAFDSRFVLDVVRTGSIMLGTNEITLNGSGNENNLIRKLIMITELDDILDEIQVRIETPFNELSEDDFNQLEQLVGIKKGVVSFQTDQEQFPFRWEFQGKNTVILVCRDNKPIRLLNCAFSTDLELKTDGTVGENKSTRSENYNYILPTFAVFDLKDLASFYYYDYEAMIKQIQKTTFCEKMVEPLNQLVLRMIAAYDLNREVSLLNAADVIVKKLLEYAADDDAYLTINHLQIEKRIKVSLSEDERNELTKLLTKRKISSDDENEEDARKVLLFCVSVLLDDVDEATRIYSELNDWGRRNIDGFPIMTLYEKVLKERNKA